jgi:UDP-glucuronate 4-epimerase
VSKVVFITGVAGFIGSHLAQRLLNDGLTVVGLDAMTDYYDVALKQRRLAKLTSHKGFTFVQGYLETPDLLENLMATHQPESVLHLAAQAGVRYSIEAPESYVSSNLVGHFRLLEAMRHHRPKHFLFASTSSVYGANTKVPYAETDKADSQMSFYAATKKAGEAMAHSYAHLYGIPTTCFRFFTVYGPDARPDMALSKFVKAILADQPIDVYNHGNLSRDFTYIDDLVEAVVRLTTKPPVGHLIAPFRVVNIGNSSPTKLLDFISAIEAALGKKAKLNMMDMQPGDVPQTWADTQLLTSLIGPIPHTDLKIGVKKFVDWYQRQS